MLPNLYVQILELPKLGRALKLVVNFGNFKICTLIFGTLPNLYAYKLGTVPKMYAYKFGNVPKMYCTFWATCQKCKGSTLHKPQFTVSRKIAQKKGEAKGIVGA